MTWGHAVSHDLLHWKQLPPAIPEADGIMIFTGSTVVDEHNLSGFCTNGKPCMVAIYTGHTPASNGHPALQTQNLAYSNDRGRTWTKYAGNPVLDLHMSDFRDPKVFWSRQTARWVMVVSLPNDHKVSIYGSQDLKHWSALSDFGPAGATAGQWECPELFELPLEGKQGATRWVLKIGLNPGARQGGSGEQYFIGRFDGTRFVNDNPVTQTMWTDYGKDCYCALTFNNLPPGRPIVMIGWMSNWQYAKDVPTTPWRGQMTFPRRLSLRMTPQGLRLIQLPLELKGFETKPEGHSFRIAAEIPLGSAQEVGLRILSGNASYTLIGYDRKTQTLFFDRTHSGLTSFSKDFPGRTEAPLALEKPVLRLNVLVDRNSVEIFADDGRVASTNLVFPPASASGVEFYAKGGKPGDVSVDAGSIPSIWAME
jgi:sucrose-6-phosphate hydrolase SacC (GH32 family)